MADVIAVLKKYGLDELDAKVYLALLEIGDSTATKISERTGIGRVHTYQITHRLIHKGLASYVIKNNVKYFIAAEPKTLLQNLKSVEEELKSIMPVLEEKRTQYTQQTKVEIYRGREGINTIFNLILRDAKPYFFIGGIEESCNIFELQSKIFVKRAEKIKLRGKILARQNDNFFAGKYEEFRYLPDKIRIPTTTWTWSDKTGIFVWSEPYYCILIENKKIAKSNVATFNYIFETAKKPTLKEVRKRLLCDLG